MGVKIENTNENFFKEFKQLLEFFDKSPNILTSEGFTSDAFLLMKNFVISNPDNLTAQLFFRSVDEEFIRVGSDACYYFRIMKHLASTVLAGETDPKNVKEKLRKLIESVEITTVSFSRYSMFLDRGFSEIVLDAVLEADGGYLCAEVSQSADHDYISKENGFRFAIEPTDIYEVSDVRVLVLEKNYPVEVIANLAKQCSPKPLFVICLGKSKDIQRFAKVNEHTGLKVVFARSEYRDADFEQDLKRYTNQSIVLKASDIKHDSAGSAISVKSSGDHITILSSQTYLQKLHLAQLVKKISSESSPLVRQQLQSRVQNMSGESTVLNVCANSKLEAEAKLQKYYTEILRISQIISQGQITKNSLSPEFVGIPFMCYSTLVSKAVTDIYYAMSTTRVIQQ